MSNGIHTVDLVYSTEHVHSVNLGFVFALPGPRHNVISPHRNRISAHESTESFHDIGNVETHTENYWCRCNLCLH